MQATETPYDDGFEPRRFDWATACLSLVAFFSFVLWLAVFGQLVFYVPGSQRIFDGFRMKLPHVTVLVIHHGWWCTPALIGVGLAACVATRSRWAWFFLLIVLPLGINAVVFLSMFMPREMLFEGLLR